MSSDLNKKYEYDCAIEISQNSDPVKYEFDKKTNAIRVDRFLNVAMQYPCNYGFIPQTLGDDGDPVDVLVISRYPIIPGAFIKIRPVGVLQMKDEAGSDAKILAVPISKVDKYYDYIKDIEDINPMILKMIKHFFEKYKDLEEGKWVEVLDFANKTTAIEIIENGIKKYNQGTALEV